MAAAPGGCDAMLEKQTNGRTASSFHLHFPWAKVQQLPLKKFSAVKDKHAQSLKVLAHVYAGKKGRK